MKPNELYEILKRSVRSNGVPLFNKEQFALIVHNYGKEEFHKTLAEFITKEKPPYPLKEFNIHKVVKTFNKLKVVNFANYISTSNKEVLEKYDDYKYPYSKYGLGIIKGPNTFNYVSNYFMNEERLKCGSYGFKAPITRWDEGDNIWDALGSMFRLHKQIKLKTYEDSIRLGTYIATQFKPIVAKVIYEMTDAKTVLDTSMGWGDRLTGFYTSSATHYIGCDPNPNTFKIYKEMIKFYDNLTGGQKTTQIYNCGAEDLPWDEINNVDCAFTSPPYFSTERYNEGGDKEELQSWAKFNEYEKWRDEFFLPVAENSFNSLSENGVLMVNILDPKIKKKRYRSGDELVESLKDNFLGQVGMRIMQRPQGKNVFKDKDGKFDKDAMQEYMKKIYIENIWCFSKNKDTDILNIQERPTLEKFM